MDRDITYIEAGQSTDVDTLVEYCQQGAIDSAARHDGPLSAWRDGRHLIESYLDHNTVAGADVLADVELQLTAWLRSQIVSAIPLEARRYEADERVVLVRREAQPSERYYWSDPVDGSPRGASSDTYVVFLNREEAISEAQRLGYTVTED